MPVPARVASVLVAVSGGAIDDTNRSWIELIPTCEKARNGPWFFTVTREDLDVYAAGMSEQAGRIPVDYDHEGDEGGSTRAAGWFTGDTRIVAAGEEAPDGSTADHVALWAEVEWTPRAVEEIRGGEFRFTSPVFNFEHKDPKSGLMTKAKAIVASTLTNRPYFKQMAPVTATEVVWEAGEGWQALSDLVYQALNPGGPEYASFWVMDLAANKALVSSYSDQTKWVVPFTRDGDQIDLAARDEWVAAEQEWVAASQASLQSNRATRPFIEQEITMPNAVLAKTLGLPEDATDEQINAAAQAAVTKASDLEAAATANETADDDRIAKLEKDLEEERKLRVTAQVQTSIDNAVREMRITPAQGETFAEQFAGNPDGLTTMLAAFEPGSVRAKLKGVAGREGEGGPEEQEIEKAAARFESDDADGVEGVDLHVAAEKILASEGKHPGNYSADDYARALDQAQAAA